MEIRIYRSIKHFTEGKTLLCVRVDSPETLSFQNALAVFRSVYGKDVVIVFVCV